MDYRQMRLVSAVECVDTPIELKEGQRMVVFVRHGQSRGNVAGEAERMAADFRDCALTEEGQKQATALKAVADGWRVQTIIASPLTRAIQTACLAFQESAIPIVTWPIVTEAYGYLPECQGRPRPALTSSVELQVLPKFERVCFDNVSDHWWDIADDVDSRVKAFITWLGHTPHSRVGVVTHWGFLNHLLRNHCRWRETFSLHNCTYIKTVWEPKQ
eukprot:m.41626 g.41626  ORF g.41626 m.41626 type:complete len:216 (+) comp12026_c0_seq1:140-787(+)